MSGYTKGPWVAEFDGDWFVNTPDVKINVSEGVDELLAVYVSNNPATREANARLIASAPKLVESLQDLLDAIPAQTNDADWWPDELTKAVRAARSALELAIPDDEPVQKMDAMEGK